MGSHQGVITTYQACPIRTPCEGHIFVQLNPHFNTILYELDLVESWYVVLLMDFDVCVGFSVSINGGVALGYAILVV